MAEADTTSRDEPSPDELAACVSSVARAYLDIWTSEAHRLYERSKERRTWRPEDVVADYADLMEHLTPLAERSIDLTIRVLRPWARAIQGDE